MSAAMQIIGLCAVLSTKMMGNVTMFWMFRQNKINFTLNNVLT